MDLPAPSLRKRRQYTAEYKQQIVDLCQPGIPVSGVARSNGLNASLLRRWIREHARECATSSMVAPPRLIPVRVQSPGLETGTIAVTLTGKKTVITLHWPVTAAAELSAVLTGWLK
jgi:transposase